MTIHADQIHIHVQRFEAAITDMAWGVAEKIFEEQRKKLISGLMKTANNASATKKGSALLNKASPRVERMLHLLDSKKGMWDRGGGSYKVIGRGKEPETFDLENILTGKKINATSKTLTSRWKHIP